MSCTSFKRDQLTRISLRLSALGYPISDIKAAQKGIRRRKLNTAAVSNLLRSLNEVSTYQGARVVLLEYRIILA